jgi:hypothetical protein
MPFLTALTELEPQVRAFITLTPELASKQAAQADQRFWFKRERTPGNSLPPLTGLPIAVKDILALAGRALHVWLAHPGALRAALYGDCSITAAGCRRGYPG